MDAADLAEHVERVRAEGHASWGYHSRASVVHRYVAMTIPKVACTTMRMALQTWEGCAPEPDRWGEVHGDMAGPTLLAYSTEQIVEMLVSPEYLRFSFVRNPYSRLVSAWKSKLAWDNPLYADLRAFIREACEYPALKGPKSGPVAFQDSVLCLLDRPDLFDDHWTRQVDVLLSEVIEYGVIGRFERFDHDFQAVLRRLGAPVEVTELARRVFNPTEPVALASVYDSALAARVYDHYLADFEAFGYREDSWRGD